MGRLHQFHPFTSKRFHVLLTLSSKFFSTFPHGTCSLSETCQYLALDGVYHPLWAAFSNNPTPGTLTATRTSDDKGPSTRHGKSPCQEDLVARDTIQDSVPNATFPTTRRDRGFSAGLFPLHSPLLGESLLVSFPPLSDMLKFSG